MGFNITCNFDARNSDFVAFKQHCRIAACASAKSDQRFCYSLWLCLIIFGGQVSGYAPVSSGSSVDSGSTNIGSAWSGSTMFAKVQWVEKVTCPWRHFFTCQLRPTGSEMSADKKLGLYTGDFCALMVKILIASFKSAFDNILIRFTLSWYFCL